MRGRSSTRRAACRDPWAAFPPPPTAGSRRTRRRAERRLRPRHVRVAGAERLALRGEARAGEPDERERRPALALGRGVAGPDGREAGGVEGGDERVAEPPDRSAARALDVVLDRDAVVAADRLAEHTIVGHGVRRAQERAALAAADRPRELARLCAGARVARDAALDALYERGAGGEALLRRRAGGRAQVGRRAAVRGLQARQAHALDGGR